MMYLLMTASANGHSLTPSGNHQFFPILLAFQFSEFTHMVHNQIVKAINAHFSNVAIPHQIAMLEQRTRELKALSIEILNLAKQAKEWLRI